MYFDVVEVFFVEGIKEDIDCCYMEFMVVLQNVYFEDYEVCVFYVFFIFGSVNGQCDFVIYVCVGVIVQLVFDVNLKYLGVVYYLIYLYDDLIYVLLGLLVVQVYVDVVFNVVYVQYMMMYIFLVFGMWDEMVIGNICVCDMQDVYLVDLGCELNFCGYYFVWLYYGYLQCGDFVEVEIFMDVCY